MADTHLAASKLVDRSLPGIAPELSLDRATSFWSAVTMLSSTCTLAIVGQWTGQLREWRPSIRRAHTATIVTALDIGCFLAFIPGMVYDRMGVKAVGYAGAVFSLVGYLGIYAIIKLSDEPSIVSLMGFAFIVGQGSIWQVIAALNATTGNFERHDRGKAVGLIMTAFGLAAGIIGSLGLLLEGREPRPEILLYIGTSMAVIGGISTIGITKLPTNALLNAREGQTSKVLAVCIALLVLISARAVFHRRENFAFLLTSGTVIVYGMVFAFEICLVGRLMYRRGLSVLYRDTLLGLDDAGSNILSPSPSESAISMSSFQGKSFHEAITSLDYWLLLFIFLVSIGVGQNTCNSIALIPEMSPSKGVATFTVGNTVGRFLPGYLSDMLFKVIDRVTSMMIATGLLVLSQVVMLFATNIEMVHLGLFLTSASFGSYWVLVPAIEAEWFGHANFGKIHGFLLFVAGDGGVLFFFKGSNMLAEALNGPCDLVEKVPGCFAIQWKLCLAVSILALAVTGLVKYRQFQCQMAEVQVDSRRPSNVQVHAPIMGSVAMGTANGTLRFYSSTNDQPDHSGSESSTGPPGRLERV
mmetsp:Transcript_82801/g.182017  ORF Transcript_82801/g.182017 Transcript_82801/m.182017 type:complete len:583 (-) Transcript_82801:174-1922(-)